MRAGDGRKPPTGQLGWGQRGRNAMPETMACRKRRPRPEAGDCETSLARTPQVSTEPLNGCVGCEGKLPETSNPRGPETWWQAAMPWTSYEARWFAAR